MDCKFKIDTLLQTMPKSEYWDIIYITKQPYEVWNTSYVVDYFSFKDFHIAFACLFKCRMMSIVST